MIIKMDLNLADLRKNYSLAALEIDQVPPCPFTQFNIWITEAMKAELNEPNAMTLATANKEGEPSARTVLLKHWDASGFCFFTNYTSSKGLDIAQNPKVALVFPWLDLERQILIKGTAEKISKTDSEKYFHMRPYESQIGAWASNQSQTIPNKQWLKDKEASLKHKYPPNITVPLPEFWGGYKVIPTEIEFWQGGSNRLHDRILYTRSKATEWKKSRLSP